MRGGQSTNKGSKGGAGGKGRRGLMVSGGKK
jgi:hypothetical protein